MTPATKVAPLIQQVRQALTDEVLIKADWAYHDQKATASEKKRWAAMRESLLAAITPALEQAQREFRSMQQYAVSLEHDAMEGIKAHWFCQGGEMQFGGIDESAENADGVVSSILERVRAKVPPPEPEQAQGAQTPPL